MHSVVPVHDICLVYCSCAWYMSRTGVNIIPFSIPFGIDKFERNGGKFFEMIIQKNLGAFFLNWGHFFFKLGAWGKCVSGI